MEKYQIYEECRTVDDDFTFGDHHQLMIIMNK